MNDADLAAVHNPRTPPAQLAEQGRFAGSSESFAVCDALTSLNLWSLSNEHGTAGYGYVCSDQERVLMRDWAARIGAPLPQ